MADTIKCPRCSANVVFDVSKQKITCAFCGTEFAPEELMKEINEEKLFEHAKAEEPTANKQSGRSSSLHATAAALRYLRM